MGKSDVEMEDAEKKESKVLDTKFEDKREEFSSAATVAGDSNKSENGGEDLIKLEIETENKINGGSEMEDQMKPEGSNAEQINTGSENEERSSTEANAKEQISTDANAKEQTSTEANAEEQTSTDANAEDQTSTEANAEEKTSSEANAEEKTSTEANAEEKTAAGGTMDKQSDARNEVVEQNTPNDGPREESFTENGVEGGNLVKNVQENPSGDSPAEKLNATGRGDRDAEAEKRTDTVKKEGDAAAEKPIDTGREDGDAAAEKFNFTGRGDGDAETEKPKDTVEEEGDAAAEKPIDTGREDGDAAAEKPKDTEREEGDSIEHVTKKEMANENANTGNDTTENRQFPTELALKNITQNQNAALVKVPKSEDVEMADATDKNEDKAVNDEPKEQGKEIHLASPVTQTLETVATKRESDASSLPNQHEAATPSFTLRNTSAKAGENSGETNKSVFTQAALPLTAEGDDGTPEEQAAFMKEIESFYRERAMDFKPPKFYGQPLNCLKLWRAVIRLGGYDRVTGAKLWRQVGESFHPPKTCTTVSWTFRIFYEKSLLEYERHKRQSGELQLPIVTAPEASAADSEGNGYQGSGPGRARRDAAARAMQGWHVQRLFDNGEVGEPVIKDKNLNNMAKQKNVKSIGSLKQKRPNEVEQSVKAARTESSKQLVTSVVDVGPPADWVKINIRQTKDCFEVYALVPGLLREEVRVQSDPAGRLVITGQPEQVDNPWGITPFKKVVSLPARIDPLQTSAVVSLHGRLFVRVPFEQSTA